MQSQRNTLFEWLEQLSERRHCPLRIKDTNTATLRTEEGLIFEFECRPLVDMLTVRVHLDPYPWIHPERLCRAALTFDRHALQRIDAVLAVKQPTSTLVLCYNPRLSNLSKDIFDRIVAYLEQLSHDINSHLDKELAGPTTSAA
ncbi:type III secretion system chaperone [Acanthopleuribacter pedis]|uniref:Type III secretion system chaperone n=1 Tax=Acanthopleuribacter pedis TaxID=442870 RepID=A0A8J7QL39_9BACT|nr:type III secretion system chaperone [Acanthopleuribacter pedis]MBO1321890.1 type III secretion system chaperone [Acanthopleuribacter pedis]